jgi:pimeloyl-ACP methyl ester carboxylesterase
MTDRFPVSRRRALNAVGIAALASATSPAHAADPASSLTPTATFKRAYSDNINGQLHYRYVKPATSTKPALLCMHCSPLTGMVYENWLNEIGKDRLALAPDTPGFGGSDAPPSQPQIKDYAAAMIRFMDELKLPKVDLMGYHTGSMTAVEIAHTYPTRIRKVVIISAPIMNAKDREQYADTLHGPVPSWEQTLERTLAGWRKNGKGLFRDVPTDDRYIDFTLDRLRRYRIAEWGHRAAFAHDFTGAFIATKQPILLLNPDDDLHEHTLQAPQYNKAAQIRNLPGWTHGHLDAHTVEMANIVREFLDI